MNKSKPKSFKEFTDTMSYQVKICYVVCILIVVLSCLIAPLPFLVIYSIVFFIASLVGVVMHLVTIYDDF